MPSDRHGESAKLFRANYFALLPSVCLVLFTFVLRPKGLEFTEGLTVIHLAAALALPLLGFWCVRAQFKTARFLALLSWEFIVSVIPIAIILGACVRACVAPYPCHIFKSDSRKISIGMTQEQVIQILGEYRDGGYRVSNPNSGAPLEYLDYDLQQPFGYQLTKFCVRFWSGKVVSTAFRNSDDGPP